MERDWSGNARRLSHADRAEIERLIWGGETFETAAAAVGCSTKSIQRFLALTGGLKRRVKERSALRLSLADREEISRGLTAGDSLRAIARRLKRAPSTISRDVAWSGSRSRYRAWRADTEAIERARRPKPAKLATDSRLCREVERGLRVEWSPQQISARLICDYPDDLDMRVSHTKRSTRPCSSRPVGRCGRSSRPAFGRDGRSDVPTCGLNTPARAGSVT